MAAQAEAALSTWLRGGATTPATAAGAGLQQQQLVSRLAQVLGPDEGGGDAETRSVLDRLLRGSSATVRMRLVSTLLAGAGWCTEGMRVLQQSGGGWVGRRGGACCSSHVRVRVRPTE